MNMNVTTIKKSSYDDALFNTIITCLKSNTIFISIALYLIVVFYFITTDAKKLFQNKYLYNFILIGPLVMGALYFFKNSNNTFKLETNDILKYGAIFSGLILILYFYNNVTISSNVTSLMTGSLFLITVLIIIIALAILYKILFNYSYKIEGWNGFLINFIFYIPCMFLNFLEYLSNDFKQAPFAVYVLLMIEIALVLLYIYVPKITKSVIKTVTIKDGKNIILEPSLIKNKENLISYTVLNDSKPDDIVKNKFAISMWVYIVPVSSSSYPYNGDATIFEFGNYHPRLIYNGATNKFKSYSNQNDYYTFDMPLQSWNHVVYNYTKSSVDVFVNGELITSSNKRDPANELLNMADIFSIGQDNGLSGGICNIVYYNNPLFQYEIKNIYNLHKNKDPPI
jgi:hypothetical protein